MEHKRKRKIQLAGLVGRGVYVHLLDPQLKPLHEVDDLGLGDRSELAADPPG